MAARSTDPPQRRSLVQTITSPHLRHMEVREVMGSNMGSKTEPTGLSVAELLDLYDRCEAHPNIRAAIRETLTHEQPVQVDTQIEDLLAALDALNVQSRGDLHRYLVQRDAEVRGGWAEPSGGEAA